MEKETKWLLGLGALAGVVIMAKILIKPFSGCQGLPWTGQLTSYQDYDDGWYEKGRTLDRPIVKGAGSHRFTDNGDGTIYDKATCLTWVQDPENDLPAPWPGIMNWGNAIIACEGLSFAGYDDWRLPNTKELMSIVDYGELGYAIDDYFFAENPVVGPPPIMYYWSSTTNRIQTDHAWFVYFDFGVVDSNPKGNLYYVRPVRGGKP